MGWYYKSLGDGVEAYAPSRAIQEAVMASIVASAAAGHANTGAAVFSAYDLEANVVTVWFTPELEHIARAFGATPCDKPRPAGGFGFSAGYTDAWEIYFPGYVPSRRRHE
jgi:hypothetical protein